ncbi:MAG: CamS family sex pheromone protein [Erysipelotrichaceae bacterium]|nr:CamS family sex pheromone protein [Erysipelotrichaceae bacterium]
MKICKLLWIVFLLGSCHSQRVDELSTLGFERLYQGDYSIVLPDVQGSARYWHAQVMNEKDVMNLTKQMQEICLSIYPSDQYVLTSGSVLSKEDILELQRRDSENAPYGLNPPEGLYQSGDVQLKSPYFICDIVELNFLKKSDSQRKIALTLVMNPSEAEDEILLSEGLKASERLREYLSEVKKVSEEPVLLIYAAAEIDGTLPGRFLAVDGKKIHQKWIYLPSKEAEELDSVLSSDFERLKNKVKQFLPEHVDLIGEVLFEENEAVQLKIDVNVQAKTYTEMNALAQCLASSIYEMKNTRMMITCQIRVLDTTLFVLQRRVNQDEVLLIKL